MSRMRPTIAILVIVYLAAMVVLVVGMLRLRENTLVTYGTAEQQQNWDDWRDAATEPQGGVKRREPASTEPPALVLMRDYFAMCLAASLLFGTALYVMGTVLIVGALRPPATLEDKSR